MAEGKQHSRASASNSNHSPKIYSFDPLANLTPDQTKFILGGEFVVSLHAL